MAKEDYQAAAEAIRQAARQHAHFVRAADVLERIGSLEQAEAEADQRLQAKKDELVKTQAAIEAARDEAKRTRASADLYLAGKEADANKALADAKAQGEAALLAAGDAARLKIDDAERMAKDTINAAESLKAAAEAAVERAHAAVDGADQALTERRAEFTELDAKLSAAKAAAAQMLK